MKTVVVGAGRMGGRHIHNALDLGLEVVGVADVVDASVRQTLEANRLPSAVGTTDPAAALGGGADVAIIATTADSHADLVVAAAEGGARFILCEKPMATSLADCRRMIEACRASGVVLAVNHQMRFMEQYTAVKEIVASESFGGLSSVSVVAGNFGLVMNGTHYVEMFRYMTEEPPDTATAWFDDDPVPNPRGAQFSDRAGTLRLMGPGGSRFTLDAGADHGHGVVVTYAGPYGHIVADELEGTLTVTVRKAEHRHAPSTRYGMPWIREERRITPADSLLPSRRVLEALVDGSEVPTGEDGMSAVRALVAAYASDEQGHRAVAIDDDLPQDQVFAWA